MSQVKQIEALDATPFSILVAKLASVRRTYVFIIFPCIIGIGQRFFIALVDSASVPTGIACDLGVGANLLGRCCREANVDGQVGGGEKVSGQEYERMRRELAKVKTERDILKRRSAAPQPRTVPTSWSFLKYNVLQSCEILRIFQMSKMLSSWPPTEFGYELSFMDDVPTYTTNRCCSLLVSHICKNLVLL